MKINKKKLEEIRKDFNELRHKFSKKEIDNYRKSFYDIKNYKHLSVSEIKEAEKNLTKLKKSLRFKKFHGGFHTVDYDDLDDYDYNYDHADDDDEYRKIGSIRRLFKGFDRDYYKPIRTEDGFAGRINNYIEYTSRGHRYKNLSLEKYLNMIRPYLRDLINDHKPSTKLNNEANDSDTERGEWKIQLVMQNNFISLKMLTILAPYIQQISQQKFSWAVTQMIAIDELFDTILQRFQQAIEISNEKGSEFNYESVALLYYYFQKIEIRRAEHILRLPIGW